ncbi:hypothetical protein FVB32_07090 [Flagellimonas hymeniacidonis]|uniref:Uncharacterized protein n=1 Tax=Flagellimonas hymeniacidonis TaxID=2603628 RepID=A0A5C8V8K9_9FLAO|nr:hypothetical protein [Flagellimonas hymeniacidonis]TXN38051.1 hypothetical protein FVB32_07090 [Flagellimonas hymeniacidonis]
MKPIIVLFAFFLFAFLGNAQENQVKIGDQLIIGEPAGTLYQSINVPRKNFIIKKGGIPNMSTLKNSVVTVTKISHSDNPTITFKKSNGRKFFKAYRSLTAELNGAIDSGEMTVYHHQKKGTPIN